MLAEAISDRAAVPLANGVDDLPLAIIEDHFEVDVIAAHGTATDVAGVSSHDWLLGFG
jgi:hypothetical protein